MKTMPILGTEGRTIPYDLVKQHEKQVMLNHSGQTVDVICDRGGLDWAELYFVLNDLPFARNILPQLAIDDVLNKIHKFKEKSINNATTNLIHCLRPCVVKVEKDGLFFKLNAYFHSWGNRSRLIEPSIMIGGGQGGIINNTVGVIEYEDGTIDESNPKNIKFTDRR